MLKETDWGPGESSVNNLAFCEEASWLGNGLRKCESWGISAGRWEEEKMDLWSLSLAAKEAVPRPKHGKEE